MIENKQNTYAEERLLREIVKIDAQISLLNQEKKILERLLVKMRRENNFIKDVTRKNSLARLLVEDTILRSLKGSLKPMTSDKLLEKVKLVDIDINENSFRTYLHRMKKRGLIKTPKDRRAVWEIVDKTTAPTTPTLSP